MAAQIKSGISWKNISEDLWPKKLRNLFFGWAQFFRNISEVKSVDRTYDSNLHCTTLLYPMQLVHVTLCLYARVLVCAWVGMCLFVGVLWDSHDSVAPVCSQMKRAAGQLTFWWQPSPNRCAHFDLFTLSSVSTGAWQRWHLSQQLFQTCSGCHLQTKLFITFL